LDTQQRPGAAASAAFNASRFRIPSASTGSTCAPSEWRSTESCSTALISRRGAIDRVSAMCSDSLAPLVKISSCAQP
jgi:hypothetical protein